MRLVWRWPTRALLDGRIRRLDRRHVRAAQQVLTNSEYTRERIRAWYGRAAAVCYLGVDTRRFQPGPLKPSSREVISVGALEAHKGFDFVIRALGKLPAGRRPTLTIVGSTGHPRMRSYLAALADDAGVRLIVRRSLSDDELIAAYQSQALFVFGARHEPFGLVLLEAMASGLPVVAVDEGGVAEIVRDGVTGYLVRRDEAAFAWRVDELLSNDRRRQAMGHAARDLAQENWTWDAAAARIESYLIQVARPGVTAPSLERR